MGSKDFLFLGLTAVVNIPLFILIGKFFFGDWDAFKEALSYIFTPDWIHMMFGDWDEYSADLWATLKMIVFIVLFILVFTGELMFITRTFY